ncbi:hypothetical protein BH11ACT8_BH11ACT8_03760 [soil metagenome]
MTPAGAPETAVDLLWIPLGAGEASPVVRWSGRAFEQLVAGREQRSPRRLFHTALLVHLRGVVHAIEMTPTWGSPATYRGVVGEGPVGARVLGRSRFFRYEIRRWAHGAIPDVAWAEESPQRLSSDDQHAQRLLQLVPEFPTATWGRDELGTGEMWNSNSLTSWLLARSGHRTDDLVAPDGGRAPGWSAGLVVAERQLARRAPAEADR